MYLYFKGLQTLSEKRKYLHLLRYIKGFRFYIGSVALLYGLYLCILVDCFCAFVWGYLSKNANYFTLASVKSLNYSILFALT